MPIPAFSMDGVLPPFIGSSGPGGALHDLSPFETTAFEVVQRFATSENRIDILRNWLTYRRELRTVGFRSGFQWLDGSFVEDKEPNDLDLVTFISTSEVVQNVDDLRELLQNNASLFDNAVAKVAYKLDVYFLDLSSAPNNLVMASSYYLNLFSHRRDDSLWKGMLLVPLDSSVEDDAASDYINSIQFEDGVDEQ